MTSPPGRTESLASNGGDHARQERVARDSLVEALQELLEAERAGAKVAVNMIAAATDAGAIAFAGRVRETEVRWCRMLTQALRRLGAEPRLVVGDFAARLLALEDDEARLSLLVRGNAWVVRKLEAVLPQIGDEGLRSSLEAMRQEHLESIERTQQRLATLAVSRSQAD